MRAAAAAAASEKKESPHLIHDFEHSTKCHNGNISKGKQKEKKKLN